MSIAVAAPLVSSSPEPTLGPRSRSQDDSSGTSFAAMLAGATQAVRAIQPAPAPHPATTELSDGDDSSDSEEGAPTRTLVRGSREANTADDPVGTPSTGAPLDSASALSTVLASLTQVAAVVPSAVMQPVGAQPRTQGEQGHEPTPQAARDALEATTAQTTHAIATWRTTAPEPIVSQLVGDQLGEATPPTNTPDPTSPNPQAAAQLQSAATMPSVTAMATAANVANVVTTAQLAPQGKGIAGSSLTSRETNEATGSRSADPQATSTSHATLETAKAVVSAADASGLSGGGDDTPDPRFAVPAQRLTLDASMSDPADTTAVESTTSTDRVLAALDARDRAMPAAVSHITLNLESSTGDAERVQVSMRGPSVVTAIDTTNLGNAEQMAARANELATSLGHQGLDAEQLQVRTIAPGMAPQSSSTNSSSDNTPRYERSFTWQHGRPRSQQGRQDGRQQREGSQ